MNSENYKRPLRTSLQQPGVLSGIFIYVILLAASSIIIGKIILIWPPFQHNPYLAIAFLLPEAFIVPRLYYYLKRPPYSQPTDAGSTLHSLCTTSFLSNLALYLGTISFAAVTKNILNPGYLLITFSFLVIGATKNARGLIDL